MLGRIKKGNHCSPRRTKCCGMTSFCRPKPGNKFAFQHFRFHCPQVNVFCFKWDTVCGEQAQNISTFYFMTYNIPAIPLVFLMFLLVLSRQLLTSVLKSLEKFSETLNHHSYSKVTFTALVCL